MYEQSPSASGVGRDSVEETTAIREKPPVQRYRYHVVPIRQATKCKYRYRQLVPLISTWHPTCTVISTKKIFLYYLFLRESIETRNDVLRTPIEFAGSISSCTSGSWESIETRNDVLRTRFEFAGSI
jgi:hypothetical protein